MLRRRSHERFEEPSELARSPEVLRVPLHAEAEWRVGALDGFDHAIRCCRRHHESVRQIA